ncbi:MAG: hypothetical protein MI806_00810 [Minwuiales bacterium]|nr:hypothetical protein [Minwuiales bacterium]
MIDADIALQNIDRFLPHRNRNSVILLKIIELPQARRGKIGWQDVQPLGIGPPYPCTEIPIAPQSVEA